MVKKILGLFAIALISLLIASTLVSASYHSPYGGNYGYENYNRNSYSNYNNYNRNSYQNYYNNYDYSHSFGNSYPNNNFKPSLNSVTSKERSDNGYIYRSRSTGITTYSSYFPGSNNIRTYDNEIVLNRLVR